LLINIFAVFLLYLSVNIVLYLLVFAYKKLRYYWAIKFNFLERGESQHSTWSFNRPAIIKKIKDTSKGLVLPIFIMFLVNFFREPIRQYLFVDLAAWQPFIFATLIIFNKIMSGVAKRRWLVWSLFVASLFVLGYGLIINYSEALAKIYMVIKSIVIFMALFAAFQGLISFYFKKNQHQETSIEELEEGMIVDPSLLNEHGIPKGESPGIISLNKEQVEKIKNSFSNRSMKKINILKSSPFAIWVFAGAVVTVILEKSLLNAFLRLIN